VSRRLVGFAATILFTVSPLAAAALPTQPGDLGVAPVTVALNAMRPIAPQPGDALVLSGSITNTSDEPVSGLAVQLRMSGPLSARSTFDAFAADPAGSVATLPTMLTAPQPLPTDSLEAGQAEPFRISVTLDPTTFGLPTSSWQVRELGVAVTGLTASGSSTVGNLRTFLPWAPRDAIGPSRLGVAWLWPLDDRPHRDASATWLDDGLAAELAAGGRLSSLVAAAAAAAHQAPPPALPPTKRHPHRHGPTGFEPQDVSVTWVVDPMLLDDASMMRSAYQVAGGSEPTPGKGSGSARNWLAELRSAASGTGVISLPYGDPDVAAAVRNSLSTLVGVAAAAGRKVVSQALPGATLLDVGWPPGGVLDQRAVDALFSDGATSLVLSDTAIPPVVTPNETPGSRASLVTAAGDIPTALSDSILSTAVSEGAIDPAGSRLALQRFLAETLMIEAEAPSDQRDILIAPARRWTPSPTYAANLLADTGKVPWLEPATLTQILDGPADSSVERQPLSYPRSARHDELPATYLRRVVRQQHSISQLTNILPPGDAETRPFSAALLRALSTAWRDEPGARQSWLDRFAGGLQHMTGRVHIVSAPNSTVTLTGHGGKVPVTIANNLEAPATITVQLDANQRLRLPHNGRVAVSIPAGQQTTVDVHAVAKTSGVFPLRVQLLTPNGQNYGRAVQLYVRSTVYGTITLVITGAATAALLIAVAIRLIRRGITARRTAESAS
jgi:hypothetical protein